MTLKTMVLAAALSVVLACAAPALSHAEETLDQTLASWRAWRSSLDWFPVKKKPAGLVMSGSPIPMPIDYSYDHLVDQP